MNLMQYVFVVSNYIYYSFVYKTWVPTIFLEVIGTKLISEE